MYKGMMVNMSIRSSTLALHIRDPVCVYGLCEDNGTLVSCLQSTNTFYMSAIGGANPGPGNFLAPGVRIPWL